MITGASAGLGKAMAIECARRKINLLLVALPGEGLEDMAHQISTEFQVKTVAFEYDLSKPDNVCHLVDEILGEFSVNVLINNAGMGCSLPFERTSEAFINSIIQLNITALSLLTRLLIPELKKHKYAHILNVASMASFSPMAFKAVYPASKAFVYSFSRGLFEEYRGTNLFVSVLHPGPMMTNADVSKRIRKQGLFGRVGLISPEKMAHIALNGLVERKAFIIPGFMNKLNWVMMKIVPVGIQLSLLSRVVRREFKNEQLNMEVKQNG